MGLRELGAQTPEYTDYLERMDLAFEECRNSLELADKVAAEEKEVFVINAMCRLYVEIGSANDSVCIGSFTRNEALADLASRFCRNPDHFELGLRRAIDTAVCYKVGVRHPDCGPSDSPIEAAMQAVAVAEGLSLESGAETVRKSIQRYRKGLRGQQLWKFDPETGTFTVVDAENRMPKGLPGKPGRPRTRL